MIGIEKKFHHFEEKDMFVWVLNIVQMLIIISIIICHIKPHIVMLSTTKKTHTTSEPLSFYFFIQEINDKLLEFIISIY